MFRSALSTAIHAALLAGLAVTPAAFAQSAPAEDTSDAKTLDAVTVTARKREETLQEVPIAVTAFTADALDRLGTRDIADLDAQVPNLTIYAARGSSSTLTTFIRGVG
ncbi:MAG: TonB-dependent receptor plug domain-containing protein, partial [Silanimonas sp.]